MEEVVIDSLLGTDIYVTLKGRFGPEQLDGSSHPKPYFIHLSGSGSSEPSGYIEGTTVDPEEKSKMKIEVKEQLGLVHGDVRDANIIRTPDRLWEDLQS